MVPKKRTANIAAPRNALSSFSKAFEEGEGETQMKTKKGQFFRHLPLVSATAFIDCDECGGTSVASDGRIVFLLSYRL